MRPRGEEEVRRRADEDSPDEGRDAGFVGTVIEGSRGARGNVRDRLQAIISDGEVTREAGGITADGGQTLIRRGAPRKST